MRVAVFYNNATVFRYARQVTFENGYVHEYLCEARKLSISLKISNMQQVGYIVLSVLVCILGILCGKKSEPVVKL